MKKSQRTNIFTREFWMVLAAAVVFMSLSLISIGKFSIWHDESYSATLIQSSYGGIIEKTALDVHPPLYYLLLKGWSQVFGDGIVTLRLFSVVCMLAAILIIWRIARQLYGPKKALTAMAAMSLGPFLVRYGQEMRMYGLAALLTSVATLLYVRMVDNKSSLWQKIAYGVVVAAGMYTQYFMFFVPLVHVLHALWTTEGALRRRVEATLRRFIVPGLVAILLFLPWLPTVRAQYGEVYGAFWIGPVSVETLTSTPQAMLLLQKQYEMIGWGAVLSLISLVVLVVVYRQFIITQKSKYSKLLLLCVLVPPILLFVISLPPFQPSYQDRYMSFFGPVFYSILGIGAVAFKARRSRIIALSAVGLVLAVGQVNQYLHGNNHGWSPKPSFTISQLLDQVYDDAPIYSTSLWTFFDLHITAEDRNMNNEATLLLNERPTAWNGNWSAVYERDELITTEIPDRTESLWLIDEAGEAKYTGSELSGYVATEIYGAGYAKIIRYERQ